MGRRGFLALLAAPCGGCLEPRPAEAPTPDRAPAAGGGEPTVRAATPRGNFAVETRLALGEWYAGKRFGVAVDAIRRVRTIETRGPDCEDRTQRLPEPTVLIVAGLRAKNITARPQRPPDATDFAAIVGDEVIEPADSVPHPDGPIPLSCVALDRPGQRLPPGPEATPAAVPSGATSSWWFGAVLPEGAASPAAEVGFDPPSPPPYEVRWVAT